jgi:serine/threonine-protein kinase HipA
MAKKRSAQVFYNGKFAGILSKTGAKYTFQYDRDYLLASGSRPISITLPLTEEPYQSELLFPAFINRLSEGANKQLQCRLLKIDENDYYSLLLATAADDGIGPVTIKEIHEPS